SAQFHSTCLKIERLLMFNFHFLFLGAGGLVANASGKQRPDTGFPEVDSAAAAHCNCSCKSPSPPLIPHEKITQSTDQTEERDRLEDEDDDEPSAIEVTVAGSTWQEEYQNSIKHCRAEKNSQSDPSKPYPLKLKSEDTNMIDRNALVVLHNANDNYRLGYIPGCDIPRVTKALRGNKIISVSLTSIFRQYAPKHSSYNLRAKITIVKNGKWEKQSKDYKYNDKI
ncbi:unnamed protein product, partial [Owenia fusiformis]